MMLAGQSSRGAPHARIIVRHELRVLRRDRTVWTALALLMVTTVYGAHTGARWTQHQQRAVASERAEEERQFQQLHAAALAAEQAGRTPSPFDAYASPGFLGLFYFRSAALGPAHLAPLSIGQSDVQPYYFRVTGERRDSFLDAEELDNPLNLMAGRFDLAFAVIYVLPLVLIGLAFNLVSDEREEGTLVLSLAQPVSPVRWLVTRLLTRAGPALAVVMMGAPLALLFWGADLDFAGAVGLLALWGAGVGAYAAIWLALIALVNCSLKSSTHSAVLLGFLAVLWIMVLPALVGIAVSVRHPVPPRADLIGATRAADTRVRTQVVELLERYYAEHPGTRPEGLDPRVYNFPLYWTAIQSEVERQLSPVLASYEQALSRQERLVIDA